MTEIKMLQVRNGTGAYTTREEELEGRPHLVVPTILLVEGVHCGSQGCFYYSPQVLADSAPLWNGRPVPIRHPYELGTCNDPQVINEQVIGRLFNVHLEGKRLRGEVWVDIARCQEMDADLLNRFRRGDQVECSTGLSPMELGDAGVWNGEEYQAQILALIPDHHAILPDEVGACSLEDGCGIRNKQGGGTMEKYEGMNLSLTWKGDITFNQEESLTERIGSVRNALDAMDNNMKIHFIEEIFNDYVVYRVRPGPMANGGDDALFKADYSINTDGEVAFGDPAEVQKQVEYIAVGNQKECGCPNENKGKGGETTMEKNKEKIDGLINCDQTEWTEEDRPMLENCSEVQLDKMAVKNEEAPAEEVVPEAENEEEAPKKEEEVVAENKVLSMEDFLNQAPPEMRGVLRTGLRLQNEQKQGLADQILEAPGCTFTAEMLENKEIEELQAIASLIPQQQEAGPSYAGSAGVVNQAGTDDEDDKPLAIVNGMDAFKANEK